MHSGRTVFVSMLVCAFLAAPGGADCVFVNAGSTPNTVQAFKVESDGSLTAVSGSPYPTNGGDQGQALTIVGEWLYAVNTFPPGGGFPNKLPAAGSVSGFAIGMGCTLTL